MNARQTGFLASRLFALYLVFQVVPYFLSMLRHYMVYHNLAGDDPFIVYADTVLAFPIVMGLCVFVFWNMAPAVSAGLTEGLPDAAPAASATAESWERLGLMIVGAFALCDALVELSRLISELFVHAVAARNVLDQDSSHDYDWVTYALHCVFSLILAFVLLMMPKRFLGFVVRLRGFAKSPPAGETDGASPAD